MFSATSSLVIGPIRCAWAPYRHGTSAEGMVRPWLAASLGIGTAELDLARDGYGRPKLNGPLAEVDASWSHSGDGLLVALGAGVRVGADLEWLRPRPRALALAQRFFTAGETVTLAALPVDTLEPAFVRLWCAKEAVLKAHGRGLVFGLDRLEFVHRDGDWILHACDPELGSPAAWTLHAFAPIPGYVATLAWRDVRGFSS